MYIPNLFLQSTIIIIIIIIIEICMYICTKLILQSIGSCNKIRVGFASFYDNK
jgi:hypothetical protein